MSTEPSSHGGPRGDRPGSASAGSDAAKIDAAKVSPGPGGEVSGEPGAGLAGPDLARAVLDAAKARRDGNRSRRRVPGGAGLDGEPDAVGGGSAGRTGQRRGRPRGYSGPGPDPRDPQLLGAVLARLVKARGWQQPAAEATVFGAWEKVVGPDIAKHSRPLKLEDGELTVEAESTAWATQLRLLAGSLLKRIAAEVGHNVVRKLHIHGPAAPNWSRGPRRVRGRGPRDTYG